MVRHQVGEPVDLSATVDCRDVAGEYLHFRYPLDHLTGQVTLEKRLLTVDLQTLSVGGRPLRLKGNDQEPRSRRRGPARYPGRLDPDRRQAQESDAARRAQGRRAVSSQRAGQGPCHGGPPADGRPQVPAGGIDRDRRRDRPERALRDEVGRLAVPGPRPAKAGWRSTPTSGCSRTCAGATARRISIASGSVEKLHRPKRLNGDDPLKVDIRLRSPEPALHQRTARCASPGLAREDLDDDQPLGLLRRRAPSCTSRRAWRTRTS